MVEGSLHQLSENNLFQWIPTTSKVEAHTVNLTNYLCLEESQTLEEKSIAIFLNQ